MQRSTYSANDILTDPSQNTSLGYIIVDPKVGLQGVPFPFNKFDYANGGLVSSVADLAYLMQCLNNMGEWNGERI